MHVCHVCDKSFTRLNKFQNHRSLCELLQLAKRSDIAGGAVEQLPSAAVMWDAMKLLLVKYDKLEQEFQDCRAWIKKSKKKLSVIDWLNENCNPVTDYKTWLDNIQIGQKELQLVFKHDYVAGIFYILQNNLDLADEHNFPVRAFNQKKQVLFAFEMKQWKMLDYGGLWGMVQPLHKKLQLAFKVWETLHPNIVDNIASNEWELNLRKVNGGKLDHEVSLRAISRRLYDYLKFDLKSRIHYEFV